MKKTALCIAACLSLLSFTACNQKVNGDGSAYLDGHGTGEQSGSVGQDIQNKIDDDTAELERDIGDNYNYGIEGITGNGALTAQIQDGDTQSDLVSENERRNYP